MGPGRCHPPGGGGSRSTGWEGGTGEVSSSGRRRLAVHREGGCDRGGVVIIRAAEARGLPGERVGPGRCHPPGGGGSRSTGREGGTGEASSSSGRRRLAVHREGARGWDRGGVVILRAVEARGPLGGRGGSRSTGREGGTGEVSPSSRRRRLAVHREGGWHRRGVILRAVEARGPLGGRGGSRSTGRVGGTGEVSPSSGRRRLAVHREGGWHRRGVILRAAEALGPPGVRVGPGRCRNPPGGGGSLSTGRESGSGEALSSGRRRFAVHREGGWDRDGVILWAAGVCGPPGGRVGPGRCRHLPGGGGSRSTGRVGGNGEASSSSGRRRLAVHREGGWDRGGVNLRAVEARGPPGGRAGPVRRCNPPRGGGSRSTWREGGTGEASSSSGRWRLAVHREGGWHRGGVVIIRAAVARGPPGGPGWSRHPPCGGGSWSTSREGGNGEASSSGRRRLAVHREGGRDRGGVNFLAAEARDPPGGRVGPGRRRHPQGCGGSRSTGREGGTVEAS